MLIEREMYMSRIRPFIGKDIIKVMTGMRRCGKSVMLELVKRELVREGVSEANFFSYNFEDLTISNLCEATALHDDVCKRVQGAIGKVYLFFDEIQEVLEWEKAINSLRVRLDCDIYITGSNARLLSSELSTYLAGRYVEFVIYPFSFGEFLPLYRQSFPEAGIKECFNAFISFGGMPFLSELNYNENASKVYLSDAFSSVVVKDIAKRNNIRDIDLLERIIAYVMSNMGCTFSASSLSRYFKSQDRRVSVDTILNYLKFAMEAFLFYQVKREDLIGKEVLVSNEKYYIADHGLREAVWGRNNESIELVLENIVLIELFRRGYDVHVGRVGDKEIDFVATRQNEKIYVQVSYMLASESTIEREFGVYNLVRDNWPKYVVSMDELDMSRDGVKHVNIIEFLIAADWNLVFLVFDKSKVYFILLGL